MADEDRTEELGRVREPSAATPPPTEKKSVAERWRESLSAQIISAFIAVLVIGGIGFGIGYAVGDSGHGHHRHGGHHMMERDGYGPGPINGYQREHHMPGQHPMRHKGEQAPNNGGNAPTTSPTPAPAPAP